MPTQKPLDTKGYYRLLKVAPDVPQDEIRMAFAMAKSQLEGFRALYLGAGASILPPGLSLASLLEAEDPGTAEAMAARWR